MPREVRQWRQMWRMSSRSLKKGGDSNRGQERRMFQPTNVDRFLVAERLRDRGSASRFWETPTGLPLSRKFEARAEWPGNVGQSRHYRIRARNGTLGEIGYSRMTSRPHENRVREPIVGGPMGSGRDSMLFRREPSKLTRGCQRCSRYVVKLR